MHHTGLGRPLSGSGTRRDTQRLDGLRVARRLAGEQMDRDAGRDGPVSRILRAAVACNRASVAGGSASMTASRMIRCTKSQVGVSSNSAREAVGGRSRRLEREAGDGGEVVEAPRIGEHGGRLHQGDRVVTEAGQAPADDDAEFGGGQPRDVGRLRTTADERRTINTWLTSRTAGRGHRKRSGAKNSPSAPESVVTPRAASRTTSETRFAHTEFAKRFADAFKHARRT